MDKQLTDAIRLVLEKSYRIRHYGRYDYLERFLERYNETAAIRAARDEELESRRAADLPVEDLNAEWDAFKRGAK